MGRVMVLNIPPTPSACKYQLPGLVQHFYLRTVEVRLRERPVGAVDGRRSGRAGL